ncbi:MAG: TetR/AcrR family transcriptional regulator [Novosphingobium sp.]
MYRFVVAVNKQGLSEARLAKKQTERKPLAVTINLLWADHSQRVGRTGLTLSEFIDAAMELAGEQGAGAISMRNLSSRLGVRSMAIYSVVPGKAELVALMVDRAYRDIYPTGQAPETRDLRMGLRQIADANRRLHDRHPWLLELAPARSLMGPQEARKTELELAVLDGKGLSDLEMEKALSMLIAYVSHRSRLAIQLGIEQANIGLGEAEWWEQALPALKQVYDPLEFPLVMRVANAAIASPGDERDFGLERILDGIEALLRPAI